MKKIVITILLVIVIIGIIFLLVIKNQSKPGVISENTTCVANSDCGNPQGIPDGSLKLCSSYTSKCEYPNEINKEKTYSALNSLSTALKTNLPSECNNLNEDSSIKNPGNNPIILVPGKQSCLILMALAEKNQSICSYLGNETVFFGFDTLPDLSDYSDLSSLSVINQLNNNPSHNSRSSIDDCITIVNNN